MVKQPTPQHPKEPAEAREPVVSQPSPAQPPKPVVRQAEPNKRSAKWSLGRIFWGLLLVVIGGLLLLDNFNVLVVDFVQVWRLWPLLVILGGVSLLSIRGFVWRVVAITFAILALVAVVVVATGGYEAPQGTVKESTQSVERESDTRRLKTSIKSGGGKITIDANDTEALVAAVLQSDVATLRQTSRQVNGLQTVEISTDFSDRWQFGNVRNDLDVSISNKLPLDLSLDAGASDVDIDLSSAIVEVLAIKAGASRLNVTLGDASASPRVTIEVGASSVDLNVPSDAGVRVKKDGGLASIELPGLENKGSDVFETDGYEDAAQKIEITLKIGAGSFTLRR